MLKANVPISQTVKKLLEKGPPIAEVDKSLYKRRGIVHIGCEYLQEDDIDITDVLLDALEDLKIPKTKVWIDSYKQQYCLGILGEGLDEVPDGDMAPIYDLMLSASEGWKLRRSECP